MCISNCTLENFRSRASSPLIYAHLQQFPHIHGGSWWHVLFGFRVVLAVQCWTTKALRAVCLVVCWGNFVDPSVPCSNTEDDNEVGFLADGKLRISATQSISRGDCPVKMGGTSRRLVLQWPTWYDEQHGFFSRASKIPALLMNWLHELVENELLVGLDAPNSTQIWKVNVTMALTTVPLSLVIPLMYQTFAILCKHLTVSIYIYTYQSPLRFNPSHR